MLLLNYLSDPFIAFRNSLLILTKDSAATCTLQLLKTLKPLIKYEGIALLRWGRMSSVPVESCQGQSCTNTIVDGYTCYCLNNSAAQDRHFL